MSFSILALQNSLCATPGMPSQQGHPSVLPNFVTISFVMYILRMRLPGLRAVPRTTPSSAFPVGFHGLPLQSFRYGASHASSPLSLFTDRALIRPFSVIKRNSSVSANLPTKAPLFHLAVSLSLMSATRYWHVSAKFKTSPV